MPGRKSRAAAILGAALIASALVVPSARAQSTDDTSATITGGLLSLSAISVGDFAGLGVTGTDQQTTATMADFTVADLRGGVGGGWTLTAEATQFATATAETLPAGSLDMQPPLPTPALGNVAIPPTPELNPVTLDGGSPVQIASADAGTVVPSGTGEWTFTSLPDSLTLDVPADVVPGTYTSTVTVTLSTGP